MQLAPDSLEQRVFSLPCPSALRAADRRCSNLGHPVTDGVERGAKFFLFVYGDDQAAFTCALAEFPCLGILDDQLRELRRDALDQKGGPFADAGGPTLFHCCEKAFHRLRQG